MPLKTRETSVLIPLKETSGTLPDLSTLQFSRSSFAEWKISTKQPLYGFATRNLVSPTARNCYDIFLVFKCTCVDTQTGQRQVNSHSVQQEAFVLFSTAYFTHQGAPTTQKIKICIMLNIQFLHTTTSLAIGLRHFVKEFLNTICFGLTKFSVVSVQFHES